MKNKICSKCKHEFPATAKYFKIDNRKPSGFCSQCRTCSNIASSYCSYKRQCKNLNKKPYSFEFWKTEYNRNKALRHEVEEAKTIKKEKIKEIEVKLKNVDNDLALGNITCINDYEILKHRKRLLRRRKKEVLIGTR